MYISIIWKDDINHPSHMFEEFSSTTMYLNSEQETLEAPTLTIFVKARRNAFCQRAAKQKDQSWTEFSTNADDTIVRQSQIDIELQKLVSQSQRQCILHISNHSPLVGRPRQRLM